jgi:hypothetical protein
MKITFKSNYELFIGFFFCMFFCALVDISAQQKPPTNIRIEYKNWYLHSHRVGARLFMDVYQCAISLDRESTNSELLLDLKHPLAVRIKILISEIPDQIPDAWREAIKPEISH